MLEVHAKTYYNDPSIQGGDEHSIPLDMAHTTAGPGGTQVVHGTCRSIGWTTATVNARIVPGPLTNWIYLAVTCRDSTHAGFENAYMVFTTSTWYIGSIPTRWETPVWTGEMYGNPQLRLTRVTE